MQEQENAVNPAEEQTATESAPVEQNPQETAAPDAQQETTPSQEDVKPTQPVESGTTPTQEKTVPYDRFAQKNEEAKHYKELVEQYETTSAATPTGAIDPSVQYQDMDEQQQARAWANYTQRTAESIVDKRMREVQVKAELKQISQAQDFPLVANDMKRILRENPAYSPDAAYKLAKLEKGLYEEEAKSTAIAEEKKIQAQAQKAEMGESTPKQPAPKEADPALMTAKDEDGKFKYTSKQLKDMLSKKS